MGVHGISIRRRTRERGRRIGGEEEQEQEEKPVLFIVVRVPQHCFKLDCRESTYRYALAKWRYIRAVPGIEDRSTYVLHVVFGHTDAFHSSRCSRSASFGSR